jgi:hypothetical protein
MDGSVERRFVMAVASCSLAANDLGPILAAFFPAIVTYLLFGLLMLLKEELDGGSLGSNLHSVITSLPLGLSGVAAVGLTAVVGP